MSKPTRTKAEVSYNTLKALLIFAGVNDRRYYLNAIKIEGDKLIATDGHRLLIHKLDTPTTLNSIIPRKEIETALFLHQKTHGRDKNIRAIHITKRTIGNVIYKEIDAKYPEWAKVVIDDYTQYEKCSDINVNGKYIGDFAKVAKLLTRHPNIAIYGNKKDGPIIIKIHGADNYFGLLMPIRYDCENKMIPDWVMQSVAAHKAISNNQARLNPVNPTQPESRKRA